MTTAIYTPVTIADAILGTHELLHGGKAPNLKLALWAAAMSSVQQLAPNGRQTRVLATYVHTGLPTDRDALVDHLRTANGNIFKNHITALYRIQDLETDGTLDTFYHSLGYTYADHFQWRDGLYKVLTGHGMSWKTISFAALIFQPTICQLVPVDRHVLHRLGYNFNSSPKAKSKYLEIENKVYVERGEAGQTSLPLGTWHWYKWEQYRQEMGLSKADEGVESHRNLSCRDY